MPPGATDDAERTAAAYVVSAPAPSAARQPAMLTKRREFLACARALKAHMPGLMLQGRCRPPGEAMGARIGFTASRKIGNAVTRNRAKRRLRAAAREVMPARAHPDWDYVLIARPGTTVSRPFTELERDLEAALARLHEKADGAGIGKGG